MWPLEAMKWSQPRKGGFQCRLNIETHSFQSHIANHWAELVPKSRRPVLETPYQKIDWVKIYNLNYLQVTGGLWNALPVFSLKERRLRKFNLEFLKWRLSVICTSLEFINFKNLISFIWCLIPGHNLCLLPWCSVYLTVSCTNMSPKFPCFCHYLHN